MDPVTAALNTATALFNFLLTPAGQQFCNLQNQVITDLLTAIHVKINPITVTVSATDGKKA